MNESTNNFDAHCSKDPFLVLKSNCQTLNLKFCRFCTKVKKDFNGKKVKTGFFAVFFDGAV